MVGSKIHIPKPELIVGSVYLLRFTAQEDMTKTMLRFQEHYESPMFRGQIFTLDEFKKWYTAKNGSFSYYTDWNGFNIPSKVLQPFREGKFDPLSEEEMDLMVAVKDLPEPFYIIAVAEESETDALNHEIAHGLYATNPDYRAEVFMMMEGYQLAPVIRFIMNLGGYHWSVLYDEVHAYLSADFDWMLTDKQIKIEELRELHEVLKNTFDYYTENRFKEETV